MLFSQFPPVPVSFSLQHKISGRACEGRPPPFSFPLFKYHLSLIEFLFKKTQQRRWQEDVDKETNSIQLKQIFK